MARVVVITGGGTGIGAACARLIRAAGDRVFITGRREAPLQAVANETGATALVGDAADGECGASGCYRRSSTRPAGLMSSSAALAGWATAPPPRPATANGARRWTAISPAPSPAFAPVCLR